MMLVINCTKVDPKIKLRFRRALKKQLAVNGFAKDIVQSEDSISCVVEPKGDCLDVDDVWARVSKILGDVLGDDSGISDDWVKVNGRTLTITVGG